MDNEKDVLLGKQKEAIQIMEDLKRDIDIRRMALLNSMSDVSSIQRRLKQLVYDAIESSRSINTDLNGIIDDMKTFGNSDVMSRINVDKSSDFESINARIQKFNEDYKIISQKLPILLIKENSQRDKTKGTFSFMNSETKMTSTQSSITETIDMPSGSQSFNIGGMIAGFFAVGIPTLICAGVACFILFFLLSIISFGGLIFDFSKSAEPLETIAVIAGIIGGIVGAINGGSK